MDRFLRVARLWNWLPHFRAIGETENLQAASAELGVSPSALSRALRLLEHDIGRPLLDRTGRSLELNPAGRALLLEVRDSMRRVHACVEDLATSSHCALRVATSGPLVRSLVFPASQAIRERSGHEPEFHVIHLPDVYAPGALRRGAADLAIVTHEIDAEDLAIDELCTTQFGVYGQGPRVGSHEHRFAVPVAAGSDQALDGWPARSDRRVGYRVGCMQGVIDAIYSHGAVGFLPKFVAEQHGLTPVSGSVESLGSIFFLQRSALPRGGLVEASIEVLREATRTLLEPQGCSVAS